MSEMTPIDKSHLITGLAALGGLAGYYWFAADTHAPAFGSMGDPSTRGLPLGCWILGYAVTLIGVVLGAGFRRVLRMQHEKRDQVSFRRLMRAVFSSTDLWLGLLGSPLLFALLMKTIADLDISGLVAVALQNGFFCSTIVAEMVPSRPPISGLPRN